MPGVGPPIIGVGAGEAAGLQQRFELQKDLIFAATKDTGQDLAGVVIDGMPEPTGVSLCPTNDHISSISASPAPPGPRSLPRGSACAAERCLPTPAARLSSWVPAVQWWDRYAGIAPYHAPH